MKVYIFLFIIFFTPSILSADVYSIYSETYSGMIHDSENPPNVDGGHIGVWASNFPSQPAFFGDSDESTEGTESLKLEYTGNFGGAGFFIQFGYDGLTNPQQERNLRDFAGGYLNFDVRTNGEMSVKIEWTGGSHEFFMNKDLKIPLDNEWHSVSIQLSRFSGINLDRIKVPAGFHALWDGGPVTYYIDNVLFTTDDTVPTPTPEVTVPTPTPTVTPTPTSQSDSILIKSYEFDQPDLEMNGWAEIPGGFARQPSGFVNFEVLTNIITTTNDNKGMKINVRPGEVSFVYAREPIVTRGGPVLLRTVIRTDHSDASVALVALKGNVHLSDADGSIATHIPASSISMIDNERRLVLLYEPDTGNLVTPAIQVASTGGSVNVWIDQVEIFELTSDIFDSLQ